VIFATASAILYTASNIFLRASVACDPMWVQCIKEVPIVILIGPWLLVRWRRGQHILPPMRVVGVLFFSALLTHFLGNTFFQWALGIVGISLAVPIVLGTIIVGGAVLSRVFLGEVISPKSAAAVAILLFAIVALGLAAHQVSPVSGADQAAVAGGESSSMLMMRGVGAVVLAGCAYSTLGVVIRYGVGRSSPLSTTTVIVGTVGVVGLGSLSFWRLGWENLVATAPADLGVMLAAGVCNAMAFLCLTKSLQLINVVRVNAVSSSQCALAAVAGMFLFGEELTLVMIVGIALTAIGLSLMHAREDVPPAPKENAPAGRETVETEK
jgi:DME family drug/metabolite transporter